MGGAELRKGQVRMLHNLYFYLILSLFMTYTVTEKWPPVLSQCIMRLTYRYCFAVSTFFIYVYSVSQTVK